MQQYRLLSVWSVPTAYKRSEFSVESQSVISRKWQKQVKWNQEEYRKSACVDVKCDEKIMRVIVH
jgi:hypothetical protein